MTKHNKVSYQPLINPYPIAKITKDQPSKYEPTLSPIPDYTSFTFLFISVGNE